MNSSGDELNNTENSNQLFKIPRVYLGIAALLDVIKMDID